MGEEEAKKGREGARREKLATENKAQQDIEKTLTLTNPSPRATQVTCHLLLHLQSTSQMRQDRKTHTVLTLVSDLTSCLQNFLRGHRGRHRNGRMALQSVTHWSSSSNMSGSQNKQPKSSVLYTHCCHVSRCMCVPISFQMDSQTSTSPASGRAAPTSIGEDTHKNDWQSPSVCDVMATLSTPTCG